MSKAVVSLLVESTLAYARLLIQCAEPRKALAVLTSTSPVAALEHPDVVEMAASLTVQLGHVFSNDVFLRRYRTAYAADIAPFSDRGMLDTFRSMALLAIVRETKPSTYLSIGGGDGTIPREILQTTTAHVTISELASIGGRVVAKLEAEFPGRVATIDRLDVGGPFEAKFDVIECLDVVEHVTDDLAFLRNLRSSLKPGGTLLLSTPNSVDWVERGMLDKFGDGNWYEHITAYTPRSLATVIRRAGLNPTILYEARSLFAMCTLDEVNDIPYVKSVECSDPKQLTLPENKDRIVRYGFRIHSRIGDSNPQVMVLNGAVLST